MVSPVDLCQEGYYCRRRATVAAPLIGIDANICPVGHYCPTGTADAEPCPKGTYNNGTGLEAIGDCIDCTAGYYCEEVGLVEPSGLCSPGYVTEFLVCSGKDAVHVFLGLCDSVLGIVVFC